MKFWNWGPTTIWHNMTFGQNCFQKSLHPTVYFLAQLFMQILLGLHRNEEFKDRWLTHLCPAIFFSQRKRDMFGLGIAINKFFFRSGAIFAWLLNRIPVHHKWVQKNFQCPKCLLRAPQSMFFSIFRGYKKIFFLNLDWKKSFRRHNWVPRWHKCGQKNFSALSALLGPL